MSNYRHILYFRVKLLAFHSIKCFLPVLTQLLGVTYHFYIIHYLYPSVMSPL